MPAVQSWLAVQRRVLTKHVPRTRGLKRIDVQGQHDLWDCLTKHVPRTRGLKQGMPRVERGLTVDLPNMFPAHGD